jgi:heptaprenyl diphosphate synthase
MSVAVTMLVAQTLDEVERCLAEAARAPAPFLTEAAGHVTLAGGKRFRPALVALTALLGDGDGFAGTGLSPERQRRIVDACVVVELTHVASLYHDDVMDEATMRRGVASANARYGNTVAILVGDFLFAQASAVVARLGTEFVALQASTFARLVQGQIAETRGPESGEDPLSHYRQVVADKTASLIRTSALFGGMIAGLSQPQLTALGRFGEQIGVVFQLADDLIDITSDVAGKDAGTDLREGLPTLPVLLLRDSDDPADLELYARVVRGLSPDEVPGVLTQLRTHPVIDTARAQIKALAETARAKLEALPDCPARTELHRLCDEAATRVS